MNRQLVIMVILLSSSMMILASTNFEDTYGIPAGSHFSALADQVVDSRFDESSITLRQKLTRLKNLQLRIGARLEQFRDEPVIWFLSGLNQNNLAEVQYLMVLEKSGQQAAAIDIDVSNYNIARSRAYDNAIRLDSTEPHRLSSSIYATMGYGLSNRQKVKTYSRELQLGSPAENESSEYFMHWAKIDALLHEKKLDEARQALDDLKQLLKQRNQTDSAYSSIVERAETQLTSHIEISERRNNTATTTQNTEPKSQDPENNTWGWRIWLLIGFGVFTFSFVLIAAVYMRKR